MSLRSPSSSVALLVDSFPEHVFHSREFSPTEQRRTLRCLGNREVVEKASGESYRKDVQVEKRPTGCQLCAVDVKVRKIVYLLSESLNTASRGY